MGYRIDYGSRKKTVSWVWLYAALFFAAFMLIVCIRFPETMQCITAWVMPRTYEAFADYLANADGFVEAVEAFGRELGNAK